MMEYYTPTLIYILLLLYILYSIYYTVYTYTAQAGARDAERNTGWRKAMRTKNETDPAKYFGDALKSVTTGDFTPDRPEGMYRATHRGIWSQLWDEYRQQDEEVLQKYYDLGKQAITRAYNGEDAGVLLGNVTEFLERYGHNFLETEPEKMEWEYLYHNCGAYLWAVMNRKIEWQDYGKAKGVVRWGNKAVTKNGTNRRMFKRTRDAQDS